jgi:hypothetical protein
VLFSGEYSSFLMPAGAYMLRLCRLAVVYALTDAIPEPNAAAPPVSDNLAFNAMCVQVPSLARWELRTTECGQFIAAI